MGVFVKFNEISQSIIFRNTDRWFLYEVYHILDKVFKNGPSKIRGRQPLKV